MNRGIKGLYNLLLPVWKAKPQYVVLSLLGVLSNIPTRALNVYTLSHVVIFALEGSMKKVFILSLIYFIYMAITTIIRFWFESYKQVSEETVKETIRLNIYNKINQIDVSAYDDPEFYEVKTKILKMCDTHILDSYNKSFKLLRSIVSAVTYIGILASLSPIIIVIVLVACTIALVINFGKAKYAKSKFDELITPQRRLEYINYCFEERQFAYDIKTEIFSPFLMRGFCHYSVERKEIIRNFAKKESKGDAGAELILLLADCLSWLYLGYSIISKQILSGEFVSIINSIWGLTQQLFNVFNIIPKLCIFQSNSMTVPEGRHAIPLQTA